MIKSIGTAPIKPKLFCQQYWGKIAKDVQNTRNSNCIQQHELLFDINKTFLRNYKPISFVPKHIQQTIANSDKGFKSLTPISEDMILWRGISAPNFKEPKALQVFNQAFFIQKGQKIHMPEYAFATPKRNLAEAYAPKDKRSILYKIEVPKGAKLSHSFNYIFPRYSVFECLDTEIITNGLTPTKLVKLRYILPEKFFCKS